MTPPNGHIIVSVNASQNDEAMIGGSTIKTAKRYNENFREKNPVIGFVETGNDIIPTGSHIICNYSHFDLDSPLALSDTLYAVLVDSEIFATINNDGTLNPVCGNIFVDRITKESVIELPEELKRPHHTRGVISSDSEGYKKGQFVFWLPYSDYEIVYVWNGKEYREIKVHQSEIVGILQN